MTTGLVLVTKAMQKVGVLVKGETPSPDESSDVIDMLNDMLDSWSNESLLVYTLTTESFVLSSGVASYAIGSGQTFDTTRPVFINGAHVRSGTIDYPPVDIISDTEYQGLPDKSTQGIPYKLNYNNAYPYGTINLYPTPGSGYTLFLTSEKPLTNLTLAGTVNLPPGWKRAIIYNLAIEIAPEFGQEVTPALVALAKSSKASIKRAVTRNRSLDSTLFRSPQRFNIYRGY